LGNLLRYYVESENVAYWMSAASLQDAKTALTEYLGRPLGGLEVWSVLDEVELLRLKGDFTFFGIPPVSPNLVPRVLGTVWYGPRLSK